MPRFTIEWTQTLTKYGHTVVEAEDEQSACVHFIRAKRYEYQDDLEHIITEESDEKLYGSTPKISTVKEQ